MSNPSIPKGDTVEAPHRTSTRTKRSIVRTLLTCFTILVLAVGGIVAASAVFSKVPGEETVASDARRNSAVYVKMSDGTLIAVDVWLPAQINAGERLPVLTLTTRYWRATETGWLQRALHGLAIARIEADRFVDVLNARRFVVVQVDSRGTGASGGNRLGEWAPAEIKDLGEIARWASQQPWSNGRVGAVGVSYEGNTADMMASTGEPSVKAVAPLYDDFDPQLHNSNPGGVFNTGFLSIWGKATGDMDRNDVCALAEATGIMCIVTKWMVKGVKPVDADASGAQLAAILKTRKSNNVLNALSGIKYRDDVLKDAGGLRLADISPYGKRAELERHQVPMMVWSSWMDAATTDGTLSRYLTLHSPQQVVIGAWSHGGGEDADPFAPISAKPVPLQDAQWAEIADFFDTHLRGPAATPPPNMIRYFTMGERKWRATTSWPPAGATPRTYYFGEHRSLVEQAPATVATDTYAVNFSASTGAQTRWATQMGGGDVIYPDRRKEDDKLLTYTSAPLTSDVRITGTPIVTVHMSTTATDGMVIAYLEDVAPDGRVTYLTEGLLRLANRKEAATDLPYVALGVQRSFKRADALPVIAGEVMQVRVPLYATSVQIKAGHSIRIALAGAADGAFDRLPNTGIAEWTVFRAAAHPSGVELPLLLSP